MIKEVLFFTCVIGICSSAAITSIQSEPESDVLENAVDDNQTSDLETAEFRHLGRRVVVINNGYGGYTGGSSGYGGGHRRRGNRRRGHVHGRYHSHHRYYGKKK